MIIRNKIFINHVQCQWLYFLRVASIRILLGGKQSVSTFKPRAFIHLQHSMEYMTLFFKKMTNQHPFHYIFLWKQTFGYKLWLFVLSYFYREGVLREKGKKCFTSMSKLFIRLAGWTHCELDTCNKLRLNKP